MCVCVCERKENVKFWFGHAVCLVVLRKTKYRLSQVASQFSLLFLVESGGRKRLHSFETSKIENSNNSSVISMQLVCVFGGRYLACLLLFNHFCQKQV